MKPPAKKNKNADNLRLTHAVAPVIRTPRSFFCIAISPKTIATEQRCDLRAERPSSPVDGEVNHPAKAQKSRLFPVFPTEFCGAGSHE